MTDASHISSEARFLRADQPVGDWKLIAPQVDNVEYYVDQRGDQFYIRTNDTSQTFRVVTAPIATPGKEHWKEFVASQADVPLENIDVFEDFYVLTQKVVGLPVFRVVQFGDGSAKTIEFPEPAYFATAASERRVQDEQVSLQLPVAGDAAVGVRL